MKYLNAFGGLGGNTVPLDRSKYQVTHIENNQANIDYLKSEFPDDIVIQADAYDYIIRYYDEYDIVWASPPCTSHSRTITIFHNKHKDSRALPDYRLYGLINYLKQFCKTPFIVENVISLYPALIPPNAIVGRHWLWSNLPIIDKSLKAEAVEFTPGKNKQGFNKRDKMNFDIAEYIHKFLNIKEINLEKFLK